MPEGQVNSRVTDEEINQSELRDAIDLTEGQARQN